MDNIKILSAIIRAVPSVIPYLSPATWQALKAAMKTYDYFLSVLERLIETVYNGTLGGEFIGILEDLILGQISQAYESAWTDEGNELPVPDYLRDASQAAVRDQQSYVDGFYREIIDARVDGTPINPLLARASLWANRYNESYNDALLLIGSKEGGNLVWRLGATEKHCSSCSSLNGIVARASEWESLDVHPQGAPNGLLECGGWKCDCSLESTTQRRSPKAYESILNAVSR